jgi:hypothetical protein
MNNFSLASKRVYVPICSLALTLAGCSGDDAPTRVGTVSEAVEFDSLICNYWAGHPSAQDPGNQRIAAALSAYVYQFTGSTPLRGPQVTADGTVFVPNDRE